MDRSGSGKSIYTIYEIVGSFASAAAAAAHGE